MSKDGKEGGNFSYKNFREYKVGQLERQLRNKGNFTLL